MSSLRFIITLLLSVLLFLEATAVFYELGGTDHCTGVAEEAGSVDVLCEFKVAEFDCNETSAEVSWFFSSPTMRLDIEDGKKYGLWEEYKQGVLTSVLRVRMALEEDAGFYTCSLNCQSNTSDQKATKYIELCVKDSATNLIVCSKASSEDSCTHVFANDMCDEPCDSEDQLFDGGDCDPYRYDPCPSGSTAECYAGFGDHVCDTNCSAPQCGFDGGDCLGGIQSITRETIGVVVPAYMTDDDISYMTQQLSVMLSTLVSVHGDISPWRATDSKGILVTYLNSDVFKTSGTDLVMLKYKLIPQSCTTKDRKCFLRVTNAAKYISHMMNTNSSMISTPIAAIGINSDLDICTKREEQNSGNNRIQDYAGQQKTDESSTSSAGLSTLGDGEIVGIVLCTAALVILVIGIAFAVRYQRIVKARKKQQAKKESEVKAYIDNIPAHYDNMGRSSSPHSQESSIAQSCTSKETIIPRSRLRHYAMDDEQV